MGLNLLRIIQPFEKTDESYGSLFQTSENTPILCIKAKIHRLSLKHLTGSLPENALVSQLEDPSLGSLTEVQLREKNSRRIPNSLSLYDGMFWPPYQLAMSGSLSCPSGSCHPSRPLFKAGSHCWVSPFIYLSPGRPWFSGGLFHLTRPHCNLCPLATSLYLFTLLAGRRQHTMVLPTCLEHT